MANEQERWTTCKTVENVKKNYRKNKEVAPKSAQKQWACSRKCPKKFESVQFSLEQYHILVIKSCQQQGWQILWRGSGAAVPDRPVAALVTHFGLMRQRQAGGSVNVVFFQSATNNQIYFTQPSWKLFDSVSRQHLPTPADVVKICFFHWKRAWWQKRPNVVNSGKRNLNW